MPLYEGVVPECDREGESKDGTEQIGSFCPTMLISANCELNRLIMVYSNIYVHAPHRALSPCPIKNTIFEILRESIRTLPNFAKFSTTIRMKRETHIECSVLDHFREN